MAPPASVTASRASRATTAASIQVSLHRFNQLHYLIYCAIIVVCFRFDITNERCCVQQAFCRTRTVRARTADAACCGTTVRQAATAQTPPSSVRTATSKEVSDRCTSVMYTDCRCISDAGWLSCISDARWLSYISDAGWLSCISDVGWLSCISDAGWLSCISDAGWLSCISDDMTKNV